VVILPSVKEVSLLFFLLEFLEQLCELAVRVLHERLWRIEFLHFSEAQHENFVALDDGVQSMSNGDDGGALKEGFQESLDSFFGYDVDVGSGLIKDDNLTLSQDGTTDANELLFSIAQIGTVFINFHIQL
jgi:hypothetical protein